MTPTLRALGIPDESRLAEIADTVTLRRGGYHQLTRDEVLAILRASF